MGSPLVFGLSVAVVSRTSAVLPSSSSAVASPFEAVQLMSPSAVVSEFHCTGNSFALISPIALRCSGVVALSNVTTAQSILPWVKSPPRSP